MLGPPRDASLVTPIRVSTAEQEAIQQELKRILESAAFRGSEKCKNFLQFVVQHGLEGKTEELKERVIGSELFGRNPNYETAADSIVRVKANEIRKRLAQYYAEDGNRGPLRIELPAGSYVPRFHWELDAEPKPAPAGAQASPRRFASLNRWMIVAAVAALLCGLALWSFSRPTSEVDEFWTSTLKNHGTPVIYLGTAITYRLSGRLTQQLEEAEHDPDTANSITAAKSDFAKLTNYHVPVGNLYAITQIASVLQSRGKPAEIRRGGDLKLEDMSGRPVILIGAYSNPWTMQTSAKLRFRFGPDGRSIRDSTDAQRVWITEKQFPWQPQTVDYAIVSRVFDPTSGSVFVTAAGLNVFGTQIAGEFLSRPEYWKDFARHVPAGWASKNLQVVLETSVIGMIPSTPKILAAHVW